MFFLNPYMFLKGNKMQHKVMLTLKAVNVDVNPGLTIFQMCDFVHIP